MSDAVPPSDWRPTATLERLRGRAALLARIRQFFAQREVLEVETPLLGAAPVTDLHLGSLETRHGRSGSARRLFLQTSPEYAMKRLLAAGSGPIFQITRAIRDDEPGRFHQPEFTMLEWYRPGFDHHDLMDEVGALLTATLGVPTGERLSYAALFEAHLGLDPHRASASELAARASALGIDAVGMADADRDTWLHLLLAHTIEPRLGRDERGHPRPTFVYDFPVTQAALAKIRPAADREPAVAERFEVYVAGVELANGFHELLDAAEQRRRFQADLDARRAAGKPTLPIDERLLAALEAGLPPCAGVALGIDRLAMIALDGEHIDQVVAFPFERA